MLDILIGPMSRSAVAIHSPKTLPPFSAILRRMLLIWFLFSMIFLRESVSLQHVTGLEVLKLYKNEIGDAGNRAEETR